MNLMPSTRFQSISLSHPIFLVKIVIFAHLLMASSCLNVLNANAFLDNNNEGFTVALSADEGVGFFADAYLDSNILDIVLGGVSRRHIVDDETVLKNSNDLIFQEAPIEIIPEYRPLNQQALFRTEYYAKREIGAEWEQPVSLSFMLVDYSNDLNQMDQRTSVPEPNSYALWIGLAMGLILLSKSVHSNSTRRES